MVTSEGATQPSDPRQWPVGTSTAVFPQLSATDLDACAIAGISHIEMVCGGINPGTPEGIEQLAQKVAMIRQVSLRLWSVHLPFGRAWDFAGPDNALREKVIGVLSDTLAIAADWGASRAVIHPSYEPVPADQRGAYFQRSKESLHRLAAAAARYGITLAAEDLPRTCLGNTSDEILRLLDGSEHLRVCCDANHLLQELPEEFISRVGSSIVTVHISDYDGIDERHWMPGRGRTNWSAVIGALAQAGYQGPFLFELNQKNADQPITPQSMVNCWQRLLAQYLQT